MKKIKKIILSLAIILSLTPSPLTAQALETQTAAYALDTIAGYSTVLRSSETTANTDLTFTITDPSGKITKIPATTNSEGIAITELSDYHTQKAGEYTISINQIKNTFTVYPDQISDSKSSIYPTEQITSQNQKNEITIQILDKYQNPIPGQEIKLISSSNTDIITNTENTTNQKGQITFQIQTQEKAINTYSAYNASTNQTLPLKAKIISTNSKLTIQTPNPEANYASYIGNSSGPVDHLKFEDTPENITIGSPTSLKITAYDLQNQKIINYTKQIRFSVSGQNANFATLPEDYTYTLEDQGSHTFALAFIFQQEGQYTLRATDLENLSVFAEETITVTNQNTNQSPENQKKGITITNPSTGTYSTNSHLISGSTTAGAGIKIFDNDLEIAETTADLNGNFSYTTKLLSEGKHQIYLATINEIGTILETSEIISLNIDTSTPKLGKVLLDKTGEIPAGSPVKIRVEIEKKVSNINIQISGQNYKLDHNPEGYYEGTFLAPIEFGEYFINFQIEDELGNTSTEENYAKFTVGASFDFEEKTAPPTVQKLTVKPTNQKVNLKWQKITKSPNPISHYRIYYGLEPNQLNNAIDTLTNTNQWYIPNLTNNQKYYFAVIAIDNKNNLSEKFSNIVPATPKSPVKEVPEPNIDKGLAGQEQIPEIPDLSETGPKQTALASLLLISIITGHLHRKRKNLTK